MKCKPIGFEDYPLPLPELEKFSDRWDLQEDFARVIRLDPCAYCGSPGGTVDHIVPRARDKRKPAKRYKGTRSGPSNWTGACDQCNWEKDRMTLLQFLPLKNIDLVDLG